MRDEELMEDALEKFQFEARAKIFKRNLGTQS